jgi:outer membrane lipoprotein SlyB
MRILTFVLALLAAIHLSACSSPTVSPDKPGTIKEERPPNIQHGMVTSVKNINLKGERSGNAQWVGKTAGSIAGSAAGSGVGSIVGSIAGSILGGMAGARIDQESQLKQGQEITVRLTTGKHVVVSQITRHNQIFHPGEQVRVMRNGDTARVLPAL